MDELARIVVEDVLAFAYCGENEIDDDFSVAQLERIAHQLRSAEASVTEQFIRTIHSMEQEARQRGEDERARRLSSMPAHLGLDS
jgi:hypothetical protein